MAGKHTKSLFETVKELFSVQKITGLYKNDGGVPLTFKIIAIALVLSLAVSAIVIGSFFAAGSKQSKMLREVNAHFEKMGGNATVKMLCEQNEDIKGWLNISGTDISYAVCQSDNDEYYTTHNQYGAKSRYGALALQAADSINRKGNDKNIVIFGNNMKDGTMFGSLKKYRNLNFYKQHPDIDLYYGDTQEKYVIFSIMLLSSYEDDAGNIYNPSKSYFADEDVFNAWYNESLSRSMINTSVSVEYGDDILTLVTTANDFKGARLVVLAKKTTDWDASHTDVSDAVVNSKTKYPKIWYTERGLEYPY